MFKKIESLEIAKKVYEMRDFTFEFKNWGSEDVKGFSKECAFKAYMSTETLKDFATIYNKLVDFRNSNPADYYVQYFATTDLSVLADQRDYWSKRSNHSKIQGGEWLSLKEIENLTKDYFVYVIKYKNIRIEKEIDSIEELKNIA